MYGLAHYEYASSVTKLHKGHIFVRLFIFQVQKKLGMETVDFDAMATNSILPDHLMHKNRLQEYTQKSALPLPLYKTVNEGFPHAPMFRSTVLVDDTEYTSKLTFLQRKAAEQEVAKFAFQCITKKMKSDGCPIVYQDPIISKAILNEYATKKNMNKPIYKTTCAEGQGSVYVSSLTFNGKTYTGEVAGSKKAAEQLAARTAIQSLLGSDSGNFLAQIIKSKGKLSASLQSTTDSGSTEKILPTAVQAGNSLGNLTDIPKSIVSLSTCRGIVDRTSEGKRRVEIGNREAKRIRRFGD